MAVEESIAEKLEDAEEPEKIDSRDIEADYVPRPIDEAIGLEMDGEAVLIVEGTFSTHWLNQTSTVVWDALDNVSSIRQISDEIARQFGADPETVLDDVLEVVRQFGQSGLLIGVSEGVSTGTSGVREGKEVPSFELPDPDGNIVTLESLRGEKLFLVNWSPTCGYCKKIAPDLAEMQPLFREQGIRPVFIALGTLEANRQVMEEAGLDALLLLQDPGDAEVFYGMGTPAAYFVDEEGKNLAMLAYGADQVPSLARKAIGLSEQDESEFQVDFVRRL